ncbi:uncharacterized protein LOC122658955 [Telopea speciosissima]|uniref:uncharacterized protein LOC122658955 n=1 Tax=Telopea speciosissima TaxID=54955 RepID=UPI001CC38BDE|nr:uncharacterized protein LOC122658955 [Telopea speciosissima]
MKNQKTQETSLFLSLLILLSSSVSLVQALVPAGTIDRTVKQQILASLPPEQHDGTNPTTLVSSGPSQLFLTSPSGKYAAFLLRRPTVLGAGGFGNDFCYIQVQEAGQSMWESDCVPVSSVNTCSLVFDDQGLEVFDGSTSMWNTNANANNFLQTLELVDSGDMRLIDKDGNLAWKASDNPQANQNCGSIGSPGLAPETPPFAKPIENNAPFGQPAPSQTGQLLPAGSVGALGGVPLPQAPQGVPQLPVPVGVGPVGVGVPDQLPQAPQGQVGYEEPPQQAVAINQPFSSVNQPQPFGGVGNYQQQPLVDNNPFDSGSSRESSFKFGVVLVFEVILLAYFGLLL